MQTVPREKREKKKKTSLAKQHVARRVKQSPCSQGVTPETVGSKQSLVTQECLPLSTIGQFIHSVSLKLLATNYGLSLGFWI